MSLFAKMVKSMVSVVVSRFFCMDLRGTFVERLASFFAVIEKIVRDRTEQVICDNHFS